MKTKQKSKYKENYKSHEILVFGVGREWWWIVKVDRGYKVSNVISPNGYLNLDSAILHARKFINKKA